MLAYRGIGSHDDVITVGMMYQIGLWTIIWQFLYVLDGALIKSSIIWTLLRVAKDTRKIYRHILWGLFALCWIVWQISWPVAIFQCKPVSAAWGEPGDCTSGQQVILHVSYFVSAANIFTDIATAMVPAFLLRHMQVPKKAKIATVGILSLGVFAAVATTIRIGYTWAYTAKVDKYCTSNLLSLPLVASSDGKKANVVKSGTNDLPYRYHCQDRLVDSSRMRSRNHLRLPAHAAAPFPKTGLDLRLRRPLCLAPLRA